MDFRIFSQYRVSFQTASLWYCGGRCFFVVVVLFVCFLGGLFVLFFFLIYLTLYVTDESVGIQLYSVGIIYKNICIKVHSTILNPDNVTDFSKAKWGLSLPLFESQLIVFIMRRRLNKFVSLFWDILPFPSRKVKNVAFIVISLCCFPLDASPILPAWNVVFFHHKWSINKMLSLC